METSRHSLPLLGLLARPPKWGKKKRKKNADCPNGTVWYKQLPGRCAGASVCHRGQKPQSVRPGYWECMAGSHDMGLNSCPKRAERGRWLRPCSSAANRPPGPRGRKLQGTVPRIFHSIVGSRLWVEETWKCVFFTGCKVSEALYIHTHTHIHTLTYTHVQHTYPPVFVSRHPFFLNASLL